MKYLTYLNFLNSLFSLDFVCIAFLSSCFSPYDYPLILIPDSAFGLTGMSGHDRLAYEDFYGDPRPPFQGSHLSVREPLLCPPSRRAHTSARAPQISLFNKQRYAFSLSVWLINECWCLFQVAPRSMLVEASLRSQV